MSIDNVVAKHAHKNKLEEAIFKSTQSKPVPAKFKHERVILSETWTSRTSSHVFAELFKRPLGGKEIVMWKTLIIVHKLLREGHPSCLEDAYSRKDYLESLYAQYSGVQTAWSIIDAAYLGFLVEKIKFHKENYVVSGDLSLTNFHENIKRFDPNKAIFLATSLLELQKNLISFQEKVLSSQGLDQCRSAAMVPCVLESYAIYALTEDVLRKVQETSDLDVSPVIDIFLKQFPVVQGFLFKCSTIPYIRQQLSAVPLLDKPPTFKSGNAHKKPEKPDKTDDPAVKEKKKKKKPIPPTTQNTLPSIVSDPFIHANQAPHGFFPPTGMPLPLHGTGTVGVPASRSFDTMRMMSNPLSSNPLSSNPLSSNPLSSNPLSSNPLIQNSMIPTTGYGASSSTPALSLFQPQGPGSVYPQSFQYPQSISAPHLVSQPNPQPPPSTRDPFSELYDIGKKTYPQDTSSSSDLSGKIRELEARARELEAEIRDVDGQNNELKQLLSERESGVNSVQHQMEERMKLQQKQFLEANAQLKAHVDKVMKKYEKEKFALLTDQLTFARKSMEQILSKFDNPNSPGNRGATAEDILRCSKELQGSYDGIIKNLETGTGETIGSSRQLVELISKLLDNTKGALSKVSDPNIKAQIITASRNVAREVTQVLSHSLAIAQQGGKADPRQMEFLRGEQSRFGQTLGSINSSISALQNVLRRDASVANLESQAEQELFNAVRIITEIGNNLRNQNNNRPLAPPNTLDVGNTIAQASLAIITATSHLVSTAAYAQQDIVRKEASGLDYSHKDPMWTELLVNSSKGLTEGSRQLVVASNNSTANHIDKVSLIAASRVIATSTSQLVAASRAKNNGHNQANIDQAADIVTRATQDLVEAAKTYSNAEELEILKKSDDVAASVRMDIQLQADVLKLEKELERERLILARMKQSRAQIAVPPIPLTASGNLQIKGYSPFDDTHGQQTALPPPTVPQHNPFL